VKPCEAPMEHPIVLIVDDDRTIQAIVAGVLSDARFGCRNASSGEEAISLLNADRCQALIVDIGFGRDHVKGWSVARRARAFDPSLQVIYITGEVQMNGQYTVSQIASCCRNHLRRLNY
jgi:DNA-binding response OmpR family regulator